MRAREFISETKNTQGDIASGYETHISEPMNLTYAFPSMPANNPYRTYRFSMAVADHEAEQPASAISQMAIMGAYTEEEAQMLRKAMKKTGDHGVMVGNKGSQEPPGGNQQSPIKPFRGY